MTSHINGRDWKTSNPANLNNINIFYCLNPVYQAAKGGKGAEIPCRLLLFLYLLAGEAAIKGPSYAD
ncbi:hypothetical protein AALA82_20145 [Oscillospiraceae bacterium 50-16]